MSYKKGWVPLVWIAIVLKNVKSELNWDPSDLMLDNHVTEKLL